MIPAVATAIGELREVGGSATQGARVYLKELQAYGLSNFPTSGEQDRELLRCVLGAKRDVVTCECRGGGEQGRVRFAGFILGGAMRDTALFFSFFVLVILFVVHLRDERYCETFV